MQEILIPEIDENIPLPDNAAEALPELSPEAEIEMRARTIKLISDLTGIPIAPDESDMATAKQIAKAHLENPKNRVDYSKYPNETLAYLAGLVAQSNCMIVDDLSELKLYVVNKLVYEVEHADSSKTRIQALSKLGEVEGVDAFKKRSEVTHIIKPIEEVEKELLNVLEGIEYKVLDEPEAVNNVLNG
jgi:vacuolar-type H+-ATPase subunit I/STV1